MHYRDIARRGFDVYARLSPSLSATVFICHRPPPPTTVYDRPPLYHTTSQPVGKQVAVGSVQKFRLSSASSRSPAAGRAHGEPRGQRAVAPTASCEDGGANNEWHGGEASGTCDANGTETLRKSCCDKCNQTMNGFTVVLFASEPFICGFLSQNILPATTGRIGHERFI